MFLCSAVITPVCSRMPTVQEDTVSLAGLDLLYRPISPGWPNSQRSLCLPSVGIKGMTHYSQLNFGFYLSCCVHIWSVYVRVCVCVHACLHSSFPLIVCCRHLSPSCCIRGAEGVHRALPMLGQPSGSELHPSLSPLS